jgi:hypothetical protein
MADGSAKRSPTRDIRTICLPCREEDYDAIVSNPQQFRAWLNACFERSPELFPEGFAHGFQLVDRRASKKLQLVQRRIQLCDGSRFSIRPAFVMPHLTARVADVEKPLFLRKFGVPFWALAFVFGRNPMFWFRLQCHLGHFSIVGTTVRRTALPEHLVADEHHQTCDGQKVYVATTVGGGCCLGAARAAGADADALTGAYRVFHDEAKNVSPEYTPQTVNTDGWKSTQAAWATLFPLAVLLRCFLHAWLKIRDRAKNLKETFYELSRRVWNTYHAKNRRSFSARLRHLGVWAAAHVSGVTLQAVRDLCAKKPLWFEHYAQPHGQRTSNMLDRVMRSMHRYFFDGQHLHGSAASNERHVRGWALLWNFAPWSPATTKAHGKWRSPAERLNQHRYHDSWLQNLLIAASLGGYRFPAPQKA